MTEIIASENRPATDGSQTKPNRGGTAWVVLAAVIWGTVGVAAGLLNRVETTPPMMIAFLRLAFASPFLLSLSWATTRRNPFRLNRREWLCYGVMGLAMASYQITYFFAIPLSSVTLVVVVALCSSPLIVAGLSIPIFKERLTGRLILALGLALVGTTLLALGGGSQEVFKWEYALGAGLALGAGFSYSILAIASKLATQAGPERGPIQPIAVAFTLAAVVLLPVALLTGNFKLELAAGVWLISLYLGLIPTGLAYIIFLRGIAHTSATAAAIITLLEPCIAAGLAWLLLGEGLGLFSLVGSGLLLLSVLILSKR